MNRAWRRANKIEAPKAVIMDIAAEQLAENMPGVEDGALIFMKGFCRTGGKWEQCESGSETLFKVHVVATN